MTRLIEENIVNGLINYLATRPYQEVASVMPILQNLPTLQEKPIAPEEVIP